MPIRDNDTIDTLVDILTKNFSNRVIKVSDSLDFIKFVLYNNEMDKFNNIKPELKK